MSQLLGPFPASASSPQSSGAHLGRGEEREEGEGQREAGSTGGEEREEGDEEKDQQDTGSAGAQRVWLGPGL